MYYIEESDKLNRIANILNIIKLKNNKIIIPLNSKEISESKAFKLAIKTNKIMRKTNSKKIVLSKEMMKKELYLNYLYTYNFDIIEGKKLFELLIPEVIEYIINKKKIKKEECTISIVVNNLKDHTKESIRRISKEYKRINVITNHIDKFKKLQEEILDEIGTMIVVTNNKKKGLLKSNIIINIDFPEEIINRYNINEKSTIVNIQGNIKISNKRFDGLNINNYEIEVEKEAINEEYNQEKYFYKDIYEGLMNINQPYSQLVKKLYQDKVSVCKLFANKTIL